MEKALAVGKFILEIFKNWRFIAPLFAILFSYSGWATYDNSVKSKELEQIKTKEVTKTVIIKKCDCSPIIERVEKLERWHP